MFRHDTICVWQVPCNTLEEDTQLCLKGRQQVPLDNFSMVCKKNKTTKKTKKKTRPSESHIINHSLHFLLLAGCGREATDLLIIPWGRWKNEKEERQKHWSNPKAPFFCSSATAWHNIWVEGCHENWPAAAKPLGTLRGTP